MSLKSTKEHFLTNHVNSLPPGTMRLALLAELLRNFLHCWTSTLTAISLRQDYASGSYFRDLLGYIFLLELRRDINGTVSVSRLGL